LDSKNLSLTLLEPLSNDTVILHRNDPDAQGRPKFHPDDNMYLADDPRGKNITEEEDEDDMKKEAAGLDIPGQHSLSGPFQEEDFETANKTGFGGPSVIDVEIDKPPINNPVRDMSLSDRYDDEDVDYTNYFTFLETGLFEGMKRSSLKYRNKERRIRKIKADSRRLMLRKFSSLEDDKSEKETAYNDAKEALSVWVSTNLEGQTISFSDLPSPAISGFRETAHEESLSSAMADLDYSDDTDSAGDLSDELLTNDEVSAIGELQEAINDAAKEYNTAYLIWRAQGQEQEEEEAEELERLRRIPNGSWVWKKYPSEKGSMQDDSWLLLQQLELNGSMYFEYEFDSNGDTKKLVINRNQDKDRGKWFHDVSSDQRRLWRDGNYAVSIGISRDSIPDYSDLNQNRYRAQEGSAYDDWQRPTEIGTTNARTIWPGSDIEGPVYQKEFTDSDGNPIVIWRVSDNRIFKSNSPGTPPAELSSNDLSDLDIDADDIPSYDDLHERWGISSGEAGNRGRGGRRSGGSSKVFEYSSATSDVQRVIFHDTDGDGQPDERDSSEVDGMWWGRTQARWNSYFRRADTGSGTAQAPATGSGTSLNTPEKALAELLRYTGGSNVARVGGSAGGSQQASTGPYAGYDSSVAGISSAPSQQAGSGPYAGYDSSVAGGSPAGYQAPTYTAPRGSWRPEAIGQGQQGQAVSPGGSRRYDITYSNPSRRRSSGANDGHTSSASKSISNIKSNRDSRLGKYKEIMKSSETNPISKEIRKKDSSLERKALLRRFEARDSIGKLSRKESIELKRLQSEYNG
jgi:hypothetical protein